MDKFNNSLGKLDQLIHKLEANTGGTSAADQKKISTEECKASPVEKVQKQQVIVEKSEKKQKCEKKEKGKKQEGKMEEGKKEEGKKEEGKKEGGKPEKKEEKKKENDKKPKEEKKEKAGDQGDKQKDKEATIEDFAKIDIRIGEIVQSWKHPESAKLYCQKINVCGEIREIASGLQEFVAQQNMNGPVIVMANLKPRPLGGFMSNGMVVCASNAEHTNVQIIRPAGENSERVYLQGYQDLFKTEVLLPVLNPKKKILEKCLPFFTTNAEGFVVWKGIKARTSGGYLKATIQNGTVS